MKVWKQLLLCIVVLVAAAAAWILFVPSARQTLAGFGFQWADAAAPRQSQTSSDGGGRSGARPAPAVVTEAVATATINDRLQAIGTGRANATVSVAPYASGRLTELLVESGAHVEAG